MRTWEYRRHQRDRMRHRAYKVIQSWHWGCNPLTESETQFMAARLADNLAICSCYSCRNARRNHGFSVKDQLTIQERRAFQGIMLEET